MVLDVVLCGHEPALGILGRLCRRMAFPLNKRMVGRYVLHQWHVPSNWLALGGARIRGGRDHVQRAAMGILHQQTGDGMPLLVHLLLHLLCDAVLLRNRCCGGCQATQLERLCASTHQKRETAQLASAVSTRLQHALS